MEWLIKLMTVLFICSLVLVPVGCGVSKEEQEKLVSELRDTKAESRDTKAELRNVRAELTSTESELNQTKAELEKIKNELKSEITRCAQLEKSLTEKYSSLIVSVELLKKEKQKMASKALAARNEAVYLRDKMDEFIHGLRKMTEELNLVKKANQTLRDQMDALRQEKNKMMIDPSQSHFNKGG